MLSADEVGTTRGGAHPEKRTFRTRREGAASPDEARRAGNDPPSDADRVAVPFPKIELHVHLEGAVRPATLLEIARRNGEVLPAESVEEMEELLTSTGVY